MLPAVSVTEQEHDAALVLEQGWSAQLSRTPAGACLRVRQGDGPARLELTILLTADGPVLRAHASALEIESDNELVARCGTFRVEARESIELRAGETLRASGRRVDVEASHGSARVRANDDVQLLGENVLLNCDRAAPAWPDWVTTTPPSPEITVPPARVSGDIDLVRAITGEE
jgi:hypothetical protein